VHARAIRLGREWSASGELVRLAEKGISAQALLDRLVEELSRGA
jgi:hypothetical protein